MSPTRRWAQGDWERVTGTDTRNHIDESTTTAWRRLHPSESYAMAVITSSGAITEVSPATQQQGEKHPAKQAPPGI